MEIFTNSSLSTARRTLRQSRAFVDLVSRILFGEPFTPRQPVSIYLFNDNAQFGRFSGGPYIQGHLISGETEFIAALSLEHARFKTSTLYHEFVHLVLKNREAADFPSWFHEGLAETLSTAVIRSDLAAVGGTPQSRIEVLRHYEPLQLAEILAANDPYGQTIEWTARYYADAFAFVQYALFGSARGGADHRKEFVRFVSRLAVREPWQSAFSHSFEEPLEVLERGFRQHRTLLCESEFLPIFHIPIERADLPVEFQPTDSIAISRRLALYGLTLGERYDFVSRSLLNYVLSQSSDDREALLGRIEVAARESDFAGAQELMTRIDPGTLDQPEVWRVSAILAHEEVFEMSEVERAEKGESLLMQARAAYGHALLAWPSRFSLLVGLGETYVLEADGEVEPGLAAFERAEAIEPRRPEAHLGMGELYARAGNFPDARRHLKVVVDRAAGTDMAKRAEALLRDIGDGE